MRVFVALSIPVEVRENLASLIGTLRLADARPRWVDPRRLHVTLKFIGEVSAHELAAIGDALAAIRAVRGADLEFRNIGFFPDARRPSVAWVGIESSPTLPTLVADVNLALTPLETPREGRSFVPHLTIARFTEKRLSTALKSEIERWKDTSFGTTVATEFHLIESKLKSTGAEYTTLRSFRFLPTESEGQRQ